MSNQTTQYRLTEKGEFIITNYNRAKLFSSFLPGVAGKLGIPMWLFYVNRGQCVCSMGIEGKHKPIMEFLPANWAYNLVSTQGFRTFIKIPGTKNGFYEPFKTELRDREMDIEQRMVVSASGLRLEEDNRTLGLRFILDYFNVPEDIFAGLVRTLRIENIGGAPIGMEVLDGLPLIIPYGIDNFGLKNIRRLVEAFVEVVNHENNAPFFRGKVEPADRPDVVHIKQGNFYLGFIEGDSENEIVTPIVDPVNIFGPRGDYLYPDRFIDEPVENLLSGQILENRLPSAMGAFSHTLTTGEALTYTSIIGHAASVDELNALIPLISAPGYRTTKSACNRNTIDRLTLNNYICSAEPVLDHYTRQNFLDNALRGGFPFTIEGKYASTVLHLFSRKHGDLERDYNDYRLNPTPFSQGNGNFRDVNQNRRCDLLFNPDVREGNIEQFFNLIQLDGFNPLVIREVRFSAPETGTLVPILTEYLPSERIFEVSALLSNPYTPGDLLIQLRDRGIEINGDVESFLGDLLGRSRRQNETTFAEGFWIDHWTYNLDLVENYLVIFPEKKRWLLFDHRNFTYHEDAHHVVPRDDKYVVWDGNPMQLHGVTFDEEQEQKIARRTSDPSVVHREHGEGDVYRVSLFQKMFCLVVNKLASLDPAGIGIEMESDKPDWYDALNGLPGQIGSSLNETLELKRLIAFMLEAMELVPSDRNFALFSELHEFQAGLMQLLKDDPEPLEYWDAATSLKEIYRAFTWYGVGGEEASLSKDEVIAFLQAGLARVNAGIDRAWNGNVISTYFINRVVEHEILELVTEQGERIVKRNPKGLPCFRALKFESVPLPLFLEGPVHFLRCRPEQEVARTLVANIRKSGLYDRKLKMYKVNEVLADQPMEIGRARTFSPGWFENESIWLHMEYKYMLEMLRNELYEQFYEDFREVFVPFMNPAVYGRSILENSSFIVSSANPDPSIHGTGFVSRLSGATAEFINILAFLTMGREPFQLSPAGELQLHLQPALTADLFLTESRKDPAFPAIDFEKDTFSFMFLGRILVTYYNPRRRDTFGPDKVVPTSFTVEEQDGTVTRVDAEVISGELAQRIRSRLVTRIVVELG
jgi:hypothetical protein